MLQRCLLAYPHFVAQPAVCCTLRVTRGTFQDFVGSVLRGPALKSDFVLLSSTKDSWMSGGCVFEGEGGRVFVLSCECVSQTSDTWFCVQTRALRRTRSLAALTEDRHGRSVRAGWLVSGCLRRHWDGWLFDRAIRPASHWACLGRPETLCVYTFSSPFIQKGTFPPHRHPLLCFFFFFSSILLTTSFDYPVSEHFKFMELCMVH